MPLFCLSLSIGNEAHQAEKQQNSSRGPQSQTGGSGAGCGLGVTEMDEAEKVKKEGECGGPFVGKKGRSTMV